MAIVKLNNANFADIQTHVEAAKTKMGELLDMWNQGFANVQANFIDNKFIDDIYDTAKDNINNLISSSIVGGSSIGSAQVSTSTPLAVTKNKKSVPDYAEGAVSSAYSEIGISLAANGDMSYDNTAREALKDLITECSSMSHACYASLEDFNTKLNNMSLALQLVLFKVAEFQSAYADLQATANEMNSDLSLNISDDGILMGVNTTITIDGKEYEVTTSEAMNALFTYSNTVMNAELEADYLKSKYGYEINYSDLVKNANAFMTDTIESDLYSHEFILGVLPANMQLPDLDKAYDSTTAATKLSLDELKSMLANNQDIGGDLALYGGLLGAAFLGAVGKGSTPTDGGTPIDGGTDSGNSGGNNSGGGYSGGGYSGGGYSGGGGTSGGGTSGGNNNDEDKDDEKKPEDEKKKLEELVETEIPAEEIKPDYGETDYDQLARDEYEFGTSVDEIVDHRNELIAKFQEAYESGDLTSLETALKKYGFSDAEVESILNDRFKCYKALLEGDERAILAEKAVALATADGVENYESHWSDRPNYDDLSSDGPSDLLTLSSTDDNIRQLKTELDTAKENYKNISDETNALIKEANDSKAKVQELKEKYEEKYGEDVSKWSDEAVGEYNDTVKAYNESTEKITEQLTKLEEAKTAYTESLTKFNTAKEEFYKSLKDDNADSSNDNTTDGGTGEDDTVVSDESVVVDDSGMGIGLDPTVMAIDDSGMGPDTIMNNELISIGDNTGTSDNNGVRVSDSGIGF